MDENRKKQRSFDLILDATFTDSDYDDLPIQEESEDHKEIDKKVKTFHFPQKKIDELREVYGTVVVRDFGDTYHLTQEEREKRFDLYEVYKPIANHKSAYRQIDKYIYACRDCIKFLYAMAEKNKLVMDPDDFIRGVFNREIDVTGFSFPRYKGSDRKDINWTLVTKCIFNDELDPEELLTGGKYAKKAEFLPADVLDDPVDHLHDYFSDEQLDIIFGNKENYDVIGVNEDDMYTASAVSRKKFKKFLKLFPDFQRASKNMIDRNNVNDALAEFVYELDHDAYNYIEKLDEKRGFVSSNKFPDFNGNLLDKDEVNRYLYLANEYYENHARVRYRGSSLTIADMKDEMIKEGLADAGWNVKELYSAKDEAKKARKAMMSDKKKEKKLKKKLTRIKDRQQARKNGEMINSKKKKSKKKDKKKNKKLDKFFTDISGTNSSSFDDYEDKMFDMSYNFKG